MSVRTIIGAGALLLLARAGGAQTRATLDSKPRASVSRLAKGLARFAGQTRFITTDYGRAELGRVNLDAPAIPESELFSLGPPKSNALLLVNRYRGLLILKKPEGESAPRVIGRVPATGRHSTALFVDWARHRAIVIEEGSRLLWYDLSDLHAPKLERTFEIDGAISAARLNGDLLHVIGRRSGVAGRNPWSGLETFVRTISITDGFRAVADFPLSRHVDQFGELKFQDDFALAISKTDRRIELLDVSAADGHIKPVLVAIPGGDVVNSRWVRVHHGRLFVASQRGHQIILENFTLPGRAPAEIVSTEELHYRELAVERGLPKDASENQRQALITTNNLNRVITEETSKRGIVTRTKPLADFPAIPLGASNEVREVEFDDEGIRVTVGRHRETRRYSDLGRDDDLEFPEPLVASREISFGEGRAVIGFMNGPAGVRLRIVGAQGEDLLLPGVRMQSDAVIHVRTDIPSGRTRIMFAATDSEGRAGGQIVTVDARAEESETMRAEGFIEGDWAWLKRLFIHPEFKAALTFTDLQLGLFSAAGSQTVELARDVVGVNSTVEVVSRGPRTELRFQRANGAAESILTEGHYVDWAFDSSNQETLVLTELDEGLRFTITWVRPREEGLELRRTTFDSHEVDTPRFEAGPRGLIAVAPRRWVFFDERKRLIEIDAREGLKVSPIDVSALAREFPIERTELMVLDRRLYVLARPIFEAPGTSVYTENLFAPVEFRHDGLRFVGKPIQIPGRPEGVVGRRGKPRYILTSELRPLESPAVVESQLNLLKVDDGVARLKDVVPFEEHLPLHRVNDTKWIFLERKPAGPLENGWGSRQKYNLGVFEVGRSEARIHRALIQLERPILAHHARLLVVPTVGSRQPRRAIVSTGRDVSVYEVNLKTNAGRPLPLSPIDTFVTEPTPTATWTLPDYLDVAPHLEDGVVRAPLGYFGTCQARLISE